MIQTQEEYWKANAAYHARSPGDPDANYHFFQRALKRAQLTYNPTILELGSGIGSNLVALNRCFGAPKMTAVEVNKDALDQVPLGIRKINYSILCWTPDDKWDLVFTKGVLIHIPLESLLRAYRTMVDASNRYILIAEYFCPTSRMIPYRGEDDRLWARDFAGEMMDAHGLKLVDYGFVYKRDQHPQDDVTWFLMEKPQ